MRRVIPAACGPASNRYELLLESSPWHPPEAGLSPRSRSPVCANQKPTSSSPHQAAHIDGSQPLEFSFASGRMGSNSSTGLPDGSSTMICLPPVPLTMSLRKCAPTPRSSASRLARSLTSTANGSSLPAPAAYHPASPGRLPPRIRRAQTREVTTQQHGEGRSGVHVLMKAEMAAEKLIAHRHHLRCNGHAPWPSNTSGLAHDHPTPSGHPLVSSSSVTMSTSRNASW